MLEGFKVEEGSRQEGEFDYPFLGGVVATRKEGIRTKRLKTRRKKD